MTSLTLALWKYYPKQWLSVTTAKTDDGLGSGWDQLEHQERSGELLLDSQCGGERTGKVSPPSPLRGQGPLARKHGGRLADGTTKNRAFQQDFLWPHYREPAGRKERLWHGLRLARQDLNLDHTSRKTLGNR